MKETRFSAANGELRLAFDSERSAILLAAGDKSDGSAKRFRRTLLRKAGICFGRHLARLTKEGES